MDKSKATPVMTPNPKAGSSINDLLCCAHAYEKNGEYETAKLLYEKASSGFEVDKRTSCETRNCSFKSAEAKQVFAPILQKENMVIDGWISLPNQSP